MPHFLISPEYPIHFKLICIILLVFPITFITGPALPDILLTTIGIYFLFISISEKSFNRFKNYFVYIFILFFLLILLRGLFTNQIYDSLIGYNAPIFYFRYLFFVLGFNYIVEKEFIILKYFFYILLAVVLFTIVDGLIQWVFDVNVLGYTKNTNRISGIFKDEEILGHFLAHIIPLLVSLGFFFFEDKNDKFYLSFIILISVSTIIIFISNDRAGFFKIIQFFILFIVLSHKKNLVKILCFFLTLIFISVIFLKSDHSSDRYNSTIQKISSNTIPYMPWTPNHEKIYKYSFNLYKENKIFGIGPQMFKIKCLKSKNIEGCQSHPHNYFIQILTELGVLGVGILIFGLFYFFKKVYNIFISKIFYTNNKKSYPDYIVVIYIQLFLIFWPLITNQSFYNNWLNSIIFLIFSVFYFYKSKFKNYTF